MAATVLVRLAGFCFALGIGAMIGQPLMGAAFAFGLAVADFFPATSTEQRESPE